MNLNDFWGITERNGKYRGNLKIDGKNTSTGSYTTVLEAVKNLDRLVTSPPNLDLYLNTGGQLWRLACSLSDAEHRRLPESCKPCMHRLIYITHSPQPLQIGLSDAEKRWLNTHSLDDLKLEFKRASLKRGGGGTSNFRGVSKHKSGKYEAQLVKTIAGQRVYVLRQLYDDETEAARAYDHAALQHHGRCT